MQEEGASHREYVRRVVVCGGCFETIGNLEWPYAVW